MIKHQQKDLPINNIIKTRLMMQSIKSSIVINNVIGYLISNVIDYLTITWTITWLITWFIMSLITWSMIWSITWSTAWIEIVSEVKIKQAHRQKRKCEYENPQFRLIVTTCFVKSIYYWYWFIITIFWRR